MQSSIRHTRVSQGLTIYDLAMLLGVTPSAVAQLERSEMAGTIKLNSLRNALNAMHRDLDVTVVEDGMGSDQPERPLERREERVSLEMHRLIAIRLIEDPQRVLSVMPANISRMRTIVHGTLVQKWLDDWERLAERPVWEIVRVLLSTAPFAIEMRQNSPFNGILSEEERMEAIRRARKQ
jgi:transcriptional regulator with XRE-family HTH domain